MPRKTKAATPRQPKAKAATKRTTRQDRATNSQVSLLRQAAAAMAQPVTPSPTVYTSGQSPLYAAINSARAHRICRAIEQGTARIHLDATRYVDDWHNLLVARDAHTIAFERAAKAAHNSDLTQIAYKVDLKASINEHGIAEFDWQDMMRRIEAAAAKHKNTTRGRAKNANRHLQYICPVCSEQVTRGGKTSWTNTVRASASDRVIMCGGRYSAQHAPTLMEFIPESQPGYRLADQAAGTAINPEGTATDTYSDAALANGTHSRSQAKLAANAAAYAAKLAHNPPPIPTELTEQDEFGGL